MRTKLSSLLLCLAFFASSVFAEAIADTEETVVNDAPRTEVAQRFNLVVGDFMCEAYWQTGGIGRGYYTRFRTQFTGSTVALRNQALYYHSPGAGIVLSDVTCEDTTQVD